jgi:hypothetical protein
LKKVEKIEGKNARWYINHSLIMEAIDELYEETGDFPTLDKISKKTGLSINTVHKHSEETTLEKITPKYKLAGERVLKRLLKNIQENGKAAEVKLYNQLVMGYRESNVVTHNINSISDLFKSDDEETT